MSDQINPNGEIIAQEVLLTVDPVQVTARQAGAFLRPCNAASSLSATARGRRYPVDMVIPSESPAVWGSPSHKAWLRRRQKSPLLA